MGYSSGYPCKNIEEYWECENRAIEEKVGYWSVEEKRTKRLGEVESLKTTTRDRKTGDLDRKDIDTPDRGSRDFEPKKKTPGGDSPRNKR